MDNTIRQCVRYYDIGMLRYMNAGHHNTRTWNVAEHEHNTCTQYMHAECCRACTQNHCEMFDATHITTVTIAVVNVVEAIKPTQNKI